MALKVRRCQNKDAPQVHALMHANFNEYRESRGGHVPDSIVDRQLLPKYPLDEVRRRIREFPYWVAEENDDVIGMIGMHSHPEGKGLARATNVNVYKQHRKKGIGKRLLAALIRHARKKGFRRIYSISVLPSHDTYVALGYTHYPEKDKYLNREPPPGHAERYECECMREKRKSGWTPPNGQIDGYWLERAI
ncbi:MAG: GNAT family N-acetyltransferase [Candidatus Micrarchaeota archaeon]|nr:GNAT family N-acetyltransferase [Candidatus Micrarchaeota archaeon]